MQIRRMLVVSLAIIASLANVEGRWGNLIPLGPCASSSASHPAVWATQWHASWVSGCRSGWDSHSSLRTVRVRPAMSPPRLSFARRGRLTLILLNPTNATSATLYDRLNFNFIRDIAPVAGIVRVPNVMEVNPSVPVKTVPEFIAYAKANPGKVNYASAGTERRSISPASCSG